MGKIGLVTFFYGNYGSALQCFALKKTIEDMGEECEIIEKKYGLYEKIYRRARVLLLKILDKKARSKKIFLTDKSKNRINDFVYKNIKPHQYNESGLRKIGRSKEYTSFIVGSDQVWNFHNHPEKFYFLDFSKMENKIAFAVSVGSCENVKSKQLRRIRPYLAKMNAISVREESAKICLETIIEKPVERISDPTVLLTPDEWSSFAKDGVSINEEFVFLHFIDQPNELAISKLEYIAKDSRKIVCFGYKHEEFDSISGIEMVEGNPIDYVSLISQAVFVMTDSYHTTLFSIYFNKNFVVYDRMYQTKHNQNERILNVLKLYGLEHHYNNKDIYIGDGIGSEGNDKIMMIEREKSINFLKETVINVSPINNII